MALSQLADDTMNTTTDSIQNTTLEIEKVLPRAATTTIRMKEIVPPRSVQNAVRASPRLKLAASITSRQSTLSHSHSRPIKPLPPLCPPTNNPTSKLPTLQTKSIPPSRNSLPATKVYQVTSDQNLFRFSKAAALPPQITKKIASPQAQVIIKKLLPLPAVFKGTSINSKGLVASLSESSLRGAAGGGKTKREMEELLKKEMEDLERCGGLIGEWSDEEF